MSLIDCKITKLHDYFVGAGHVALEHGTHTQMDKATSVSSLKVKWMQDDLYGHLTHTSIQYHPHTGTMDQCTDDCVCIHRVGVLLVNTDHSNTTVVELLEDS